MGSFPAILRKNPTAGDSLAVGFFLSSRKYLDLERSFAVRRSPNKTGKSLWGFNFIRILPAHTVGGYGFSLQPLQPPPQFPAEQAQLSGQPMHFFPLFLDLRIYHPEKPNTATITTAMIISTGFIFYFFPCRAYSAMLFLSERTHRYTSTAAKPATISAPPTVVPTFNVSGAVISVPMVYTK